MSSVQKLIDLHRPHFLHLDALSVGVIDFQKLSFEVYGDTHLFFDLASVSKVLGNGAIFLKHPEIIDQDLRLLLEHRAGLPAWGLLKKSDWKKQIQSYSIKESETLYSDYSAMRVSLEVEKKLSKKIPELLRDWWDKNLYFWQDLPQSAEAPISGQRGFDFITHEVHDPNAFNLQDWTGHAGLFGTAESVCKTLLNFQDKGLLLEKIQKSWGDHPHRFLYGWDRVANPQDTLAGKGCSQQTFGHLGFTGTSVWIDAQKKRGHVILSNATRDGWYQKDELNQFRRSLGEVIWQM
jgi:CubicO group peptidase (beta-lactamase class C family)